MPIRIGRGTSARSRSATKSRTRTSVPSDSAADLHRGMRKIHRPSASRTRLVQPLSWTRKRRIGGPGQRARRADSRRRGAGSGDLTVPATTGRPKSPLLGPRPRERVPCRYRSGGACGPDRRDDARPVPRRDRPGPPRQSDHLRAGRRCRRIPPRGPGDRVGPPLERPASVAPGGRGGGSHRARRRGGPRTAPPAGDRGRHVSRRTRPHGPAQLDAGPWARPDAGTLGSTRPTSTDYFQRMRMFSRSNVRRVTEKRPSATTASTAATSRSPTVSSVITPITDAM
jgi:hypothetical protein